MQEASESLSTFALLRACTVSIHTRVLLAYLKTFIVLPYAVFFRPLVHNLNLLDLPSLRIPHGIGNRLALLRKQQVLDAYAPAIEVVQVGRPVEHHRRQLERLLLNLIIFLILSILNPQRPKEPRPKSAT